MAAGVSGNVPYLGFVLNIWWWDGRLLPGQNGTTAEATKKQKKRQKKRNIKHSRRGGNYRLPEISMLGP